MSIVYLQHSCLWGGRRKPIIWAVWITISDYVIKYKEFRFTKKKVQCPDTFDRPEILFRIMLSFSTTKKPIREVGRGKSWWTDRQLWSWTSPDMEAHSWCGLTAVFLLVIISGIETRISRYTFHFSVSCTCTSFFGFWANQKCLWWILLCCQEPVFLKGNMCSTQ